jgi:ABC-type multidrug transport system ATPase subunit
MPLTTLSFPSRCAVLLNQQETLSYAALLRLPAGMSRADKLGRVEQVIDALGLRKSKDTIIGKYFT